MSISRNILICTFCQSLFNDARQLRCGHSFCFKCIMSKFDATTNRITCVRCNHVHRFESCNHFQTSLIVDAFVMSLVDEHRRKNEQQNHSTSRPLMAFTYEQILERTPAPFLIAKCAQCSVRKELVVCPDCEQVICFECITQHQFLVNANVQQKWTQCKDTWNAIYEKSMIFDEHGLDMEFHASELKSRIETRSNCILAMIEKWLQIYQMKIDKYAETNNVIYREITTQFDSIDQRIQQYIKSTNRDPIQIVRFLQEINEFKSKIHQRSKQVDEIPFKFPIYSNTDLDSAILGTVSFETVTTGSEPIVEDDNDEICSNQDEDDAITTNSDDSQRTLLELTSDENEEVNRECETMSLPSTSPSIPMKKLLWSLHFKFVPQYIALYRQSILFASDRWGFVSTWSYTSARSKPVPKKSFVLFPQFRVGTWSRVYIESFSVYNPYICVFVKASDESLGNFIAFFTHVGQLQMKFEYDHRFTLRQLICDESPIGNCIWAVDRGMHCIYKHELPRVKQDIKRFLSTHKVVTRLTNRSCDVIRMAVNQNILVLLDSRTQLVTLYDKNTQQEIGVYSRDFVAPGASKLWRVEVFADNSLLLRFDDDERTGDRSQIIHHIVVHVKKNKSTGKYEPISLIRASNVYGFAIGPESEVIIGLRKQDCFEGLITCYI